MNKMAIPVLLNFLVFGCVRGPSLEPFDEESKGGQVPADAKTSPPPTALPAIPAAPTTSNPSTPPAAGEVKEVFASSDLETLKDEELNAKIVAWSKTKAEYTEEAEKIRVELQGKYLEMTRSLEKWDKAFASVSTEKKAAELRALLKVGAAPSKSLDTYQKISSDTGTDLKRLSTEANAIRQKWSEKKRNISILHFNIDYATLIMFHREMLDDRGLGSLAR